MNDPGTWNSQRQHLQQSTQALVGMDAEITEGSVLVGCLLIAEFADPDGSRWFCFRSTDATGERDLMPWTEKGYLMHRLDTVSRGEEDDDGD